MLFQQTHRFAANPIRLGRRLGRRPGGLGFRLAGLPSSLGRRRRFQSHRLGARRRLDFLDLSLRPGFDQLGLGLSLGRQHPIHDFLQITREHQILDVGTADRHAVPGRRLGDVRQNIFA